jgi:hypothetical protein
VATWCQLLAVNTCHGATSVVSALTLDINTNPSSGTRLVRAMNVPTRNDNGRRQRRRSSGS